MGLAHRIKLKYVLAENIGGGGVAKTKHDGGCFVGGFENSVLTVHFIV